MGVEAPPPKGFQGNKNQGVRRCGLMCRVVGCEETGRWHWMLTGGKVEKLMGSDSSGSVLEVCGGKLCCGEPGQAHELGQDVVGIIVQPASFFWG